MLPLTVDGKSLISCMRKFCALGTCDGLLHQGSPPVWSTTAISPSAATAWVGNTMVCWLTEASSLTPRTKLTIKHTTRTAKALVKDLHYRLDINTLHRDEDADALALNEIGRVTLRTTQPLFFDEYRRSRETGSFILIDDATNATVGAGMILGEHT